MCTTVRRGRPALLQRTSIGLKLLIGGVADEQRAGVAATFEEVSYGRRSEQGDS